GDRIPPAVAIDRLAGGRRILGLGAGGAALVQVGEPTALLAGASCLQTIGLRAIVVGGNAAGLLLLLRRDGFGVRRLPLAVVASAGGVARAAVHAEEGVERRHRGERLPPADVEARRRHALVPLGQARR